MSLLGYVYVVSFYFINKCCFVSAYVVTDVREAARKDVLVFFFCFFLFSSLSNPNAWRLNRDLHNLDGMFMAHKALAPVCGGCHSYLLVTDGMQCGMQIFFIFGRSLFTSELGAIDGW